MKQVGLDSLPRADIIFTAEDEIKFAIKVGKIPLINFVLGESQTIESWKNQDDPQQCFRLVLINPF